MPGLANRLDWKPGRQSPSIEITPFIRLCIKRNRRGIPRMGLLKEEIATGKGSEIKVYLIHWRIDSNENGNREIVE